MNCAGHSIRDAVERVPFNAEPKRRYLVVPSQQETKLAIRKQIEQPVKPMKVSPIPMIARHCLRCWMTPS